MPGAGNGGPPDDMPTVPRLDLDYDDIERGELIGQGGNADVYRGRVIVGDGELDLAIKQPRFQETLHRDSVSRFVEEAETWARLDDHEGVVGIVDHGTEPLPWLALEYMDGGTLVDVLGTDLSLEQRLWIAIQIVRAVRHAHRHGIAHLDLKPSNVLFRQVEGRWPVPKVSDWGLARMMLEDTGSIEGLSPQYAAPEQFDPDSRGSPDDITDIYQLGVLAYELASGRLPFNGPAPTVMQSVLNDDPPAPSDVTDVPETVDDAVLPAIATNREDRYEATVDFRRALKSLYESVRGSNSGSRSARAGEMETSDADPRVAGSAASTDDTQANSDTSATSAPDTETDAPEGGHDAAAVDTEVNANEGGDSRTNKSGHSNPDTTQDGENVETGITPGDESTSEIAPSNNGEDQHPPVADPNAVPPMDTPFSQTVQEQQAAQGTEQEGDSEQSAATFARSVATILYGIGSVVLTILPIFLKPPSFRTPENSAATFAMLGGVLLIGGAAGRVAGVQTKIIRGIGVAGVLVFLSGFIMILLFS